MSRKVFIGYSTRVVPDVERLMPEFESRAGTKDEDKKKVQITEKQEAWKRDAKNMPYTGTFDKVHIAIQPDPHEEDPELKRGKVVTYDSASRYPFGTRTAVSRMVGSLLLRYFPTAWSDDIVSKSIPKAVFIGFNPRRFLKMLGIECSLPTIRKTLPAGLWYGNSDHRDIGEAVIPRDFPLLGWSTMLRRRREGLNEEDTAKYDAVIKDWTGPGNDPEQDVKIAIVFAVQLNFVRDFPFFPLSSE